MNWALQHTTRLAVSLVSLDKELEAMAKRSEKADDPFARNKSHIQRLSAYLSAATETLKARVAQLEAVPEEYWNEQQLAQQCQALYRVWQNFRGLLALREGGEYRQWLEAADDFAWACYEPYVLAARAKQDPNRMEKLPPFIYPEGVASPLVRPSGHAFLAEQLGRDTKVVNQMEKLLDALPLSMIALPWHLLSQPEFVVTLAHEVGHLVERDFAISTSLDSSITGAVHEDNQTAWLSWRCELFADFFGTLIAGPAFAFALAAVLARGPTVVANQKKSGPKWGQYPLYHLRVELCAEVLTQTFFKEGSSVTGWAKYGPATLLSRWRGTYTSFHDRSQLHSFSSDLKPLVAALLGMKPKAFGGKTLGEVNGYTDKSHAKVLADAKNLLAGAIPSAEKAFPLMLAAQLAFAHKPKTYADKNAAKKVLEKIPRATAPRAQPAAPGNMQDTLKKDRQAGSRFQECFQ